MLDKIKQAIAKLKQAIVKFKKAIIVFFIGAVALAGTQIDKTPEETPIEIPAESDKIIIKELPQPQQNDGILYRGTFKLRQIDSVNGQLVVVEKDEPIIVGKDFYNNCRERGQEKAECIKEIKDRIADEIKRSRERALEEIEMLETQETDYSNELDEEARRMFLIE